MSVRQRRRGLVPFWIGRAAIQGERHELPGWATAEDNGISVAFDVELDDDLRREGRGFDLIHSVNAMRRAAGIELTDRIVLTLPEADADLPAHRDWIAREVLAGEIDLRAGLTEPAIVKAETTATCPCGRGACTPASSRAGAGLPPAPLGSVECGALGSSPAWHPRPNR